MHKYAKLVAQKILEESELCKDKSCCCSPSSRTFVWAFLPPQVSFASLPSPAVMDIRPLLALASDKVEREDVFLNVNVVAYASMLA